MARRPTRQQLRSIVRRALSSRQNPPPACRASDVEQAQAGDSRALGLVVQCHQSTVERVVRARGGRTRSKAFREDLVQDSWVRILGRIGDYDKARGTLKKWIEEVARDVARDELRRKKRQEGRLEKGETGVAAAYEATMHPRRFPKPDAALHIQDRMRVMEAALDKLTFKERIAFVAGRIMMLPKENALQYACTAKLCPACGYVNGGISTYCLRCEAPLKKKPSWPGGDFDPDFRRALSRAKKVVDAHMERDNPAPSIDMEDISEPGRILQVAGASGAGWGVAMYEVGYVAEAFGRPKSDARSIVVRATREGVIERGPNGVHVTERFQDPAIQARQEEATRGSRSAQEWGSRMEDWRLYEAHLFYN